MGKSSQLFLRPEEWNTASKPESTQHKTIAWHRFFFFEFIDCHSSKTVDWYAAVTLGLSTNIWFYQYDLILSSINAYTPIC